MALKVSVNCQTQSCDPRGTSRNDQGCSNCQDQIRRKTKKRWASGRKNSKGVRYLNTDQTRWIGHGVGMEK